MPNIRFTVYRGQDGPRPQQERAYLNPETVESLADLSDRLRLTDRDMAEAEVELMRCGRWWKDAGTLVVACRS